MIERANTVITDDMLETMPLEDPVLTPADIALDLDATARSAGEGRMYWDGKFLVVLGLIKANCTPLFERFSPGTTASFQRAALDFKHSGQASSRLLAETLRVLSKAVKESPTSVIDSQWVSLALKNTTFRRQKLSMRRFLEHWKTYPHSVIKDDALNLLAQAAGAASVSNNVESDDPEKSWLSDDEYAAVLNITWHDYDRSCATQTALIRLLSLQYARRPSQLANLKFCDLKSGSSKDLEEHTENEIHFPAAKEHFVEIEFRGGAFEKHPIANHLWEMLLIQREDIKNLFEQTLRISIAETDVDQLPIFATRGRIVKAVNRLSRTLGLNPTKHLNDQLFHCLACSVGTVIRFKSNMRRDYDRGHGLSAPPELPLSPRTGKPILVTSVRLRHTRIRQLARMGVPKSVLSFWLGHNGDGALKSYFNDPAEKAREIDRHMSPGLVPIAQAFHGRIITSDAEATHPDNPMKSLELAKDGELFYMGKCGKLSMCATTSVPIPCYRCRTFEPLVDAPHEEVLEALIYRHAQEQAVIKPGSMRNLLNPIDLSDDIRAVERCIALCRAKREDA